MIKKTAGYLLKIFLAIVMLVCLLLALLQTSWAKNHFRKILEEKLSQEKIFVSVGKIKGTIPFHFSINEIYVRLSDNQTILLSDVDFKLAIPLHNRIYLDSLTVNELYYTYNKLQSLEASNKKPSWGLWIRNIKIKKAYLQNEPNNSKILCSAIGGIKFSPNFKRPSFYANIKDLESHDYLNIALKRKFPTQKLSFESSGSIQSLARILKLDFDSSLNFKISLKNWKGRLSAHLKNISSSKYPFLSGNLDLKSSCLFENGLSLERMDLKSSFLKANGSLAVDPNFNLDKASLNIEIPNLNIFNKYMPISGKLNGILLKDTKTSSLSLDIPELKIGNASFLNTKAGYIAKAINTEWNGEAFLHGKNEKNPLNGSALFNFEPNKLFNLSDGFLAVGENKIGGNLFINLQQPIIQGSITAEAPFLSDFEDILVNSRISGSLGGNFSFSSTPKTDLIFRGNLLLKEVQYKDYFVKELSLYADSLDLFEKTQGQLTLQSTGITFLDMNLDLFSLNARCGQTKDWFFDIYTKGEWRNPVELKANGYLMFHPDSLTLKIENASGYILEEALVLTEPLFLNWNDDFFYLKKCFLKSKKGHLLAEINLSRNNSKATISASNFPISPLSLFNPNLSLKGEISLNFYLKEQKDSLESSLNLNLEKTSISQTESQKQIKVLGSLQANLNKDILQINSNLASVDDQHFSLSATLPIKLQTFPVKISLKQEMPLACHLQAEGKIEQIFDFIDIGTQGITGDFKGNLFLSGTAKSPTLLGEAYLEHGTYENYYTGTSLKDLDAFIKSEKNEINLVYLLAKDDSGSFNAIGKIDLDPAKLFPFKIEANTTNLAALKVDILKSYISGPMSIEGNLKGASLKGDFKVPKAFVEIPDQLPTNIPYVEVDYIHVPKYIKTFNYSPSRYPLNLDFKLSAEDSIFLSGRGLNSEWGGNISMQGITPNPKAEGKLTLRRGSFNFMGKIFSLTDGEVVFNNNTRNAYLNLSGSLITPDCTIIAVLRGPLTSPTLSFQSTPQMPTSALLSRIMFNKDVSEISPIQAIQLAHALVTLSGKSGPDVLEAIRKNLGVDRLTIVSSPHKADEVFVQIGKYLTKGVMVTLSQSAHSSDIIVEVELTKGFIFQAETMDQEEGKFSLKWNYNY